jgi:heme exporter protein C
MTARDELGASLRESWLGGLTIVSLAATLLFSLVISPADSNLGDSARLLYLHVPTAWIAFLAFFVTALASALYLLPRTRTVGWDHLAGAAAEFGVLCTGLTLFVGSVWGRAEWGTWWQWEARLTTTAVLFFLYLGYLALRHIDDRDGGGQGAAIRNAIAALLGFVQVPIVHFSVTWWTSLHQEGSVFNDRLDVNINDGRMQFTLWLAVAAFTLLFAWCCQRRIAQLELEASSAADDLDSAIAQRIGATVV